MMLTVEMDRFVKMANALTLAGLMIHVHTQWHASIKDVKIHAVCLVLVEGMHIVKEKITELYVHVQLNLEVIHFLHVKDKSLFRNSVVEKIMNVVLVTFVNVEAALKDVVQISTAHLIKLVIMEFAKIHVNYQMLVASTLTVLRMLIVQFAHVTQVLLVIHKLNVYHIKM